MVNMPPRHGKSETVSIHFPAWFLGKHPDKRIIIACHSELLAKKFGNRIKKIIESPEFQQIFPNCRLSHDSKAKGYFETTAGGGFLATSIGGGATGHGADLLIIDDPIKNAQDAYSEAVRENVHDFYNAVALTRLEPGGRIVIVHTRWHENDLTGWLLDPHEQPEIDDWDILKLKAIAENDTDDWRKAGEALWPERFSEQYLGSLKRRLGKWEFTSLYQQEPSAVEGHMILREWFRYYSWNPWLAANRDLKAFINTAPYRILQSWDTALEIEEEHDFSVCTTWLDTASGLYLLDVWRKKVIGPDLLQAAKELAATWKPSAILIEKKASGHGLIQSMRILTNDPKSDLKVPIIAYIPRMAKDLRVQMSLAPMYEGKRIIHPYNAPWLPDYENELCSFPAAAHDDQADSASNLADWLLNEEDRMRQFAEGDEEYALQLKYEAFNQ